MDEKTLAVNSASLSSDGKTLTMDLGRLKEGYLHMLDMSGLRSKSGAKVLGNRIRYQVVKAPK